MVSYRVMLSWFAIVLAMGISSSYPVDNAGQEENDAAKSDLKVRHKARNVLEIILQIHSYNVKHKKSFSLRLNDKSNEQVTAGEQAKNNGSEKHQVKKNVD